MKRPHLFPDLVYKIKRRLFRKQEKRQEAEQWCAKLAIDTNTAIEKLTGGPAPQKVEHLFYDCFEKAENIVREVPEGKKMGGAGNLDLIYWAAERLKVTRVIETGVAYGWSSLVILLSLNNRSGQNIKLISTDRPYIGRDNEQYVGCVVPEELRSMWLTLRLPDRQALPKALKVFDRIDMCHYDSDKSYDGRMWAYPLLWEVLRPGGFFISDDIGDNLAFYEFSKMVACDPIVVKSKGKYVGVIIKPWET